MINSNISLRNNQVILQRDLQAIYWLGGRLSGYNEPEVISDLPKFTDLKKNILKTMLMYLGVNHKVYVSQQTIAEKVGCHHDTVYEAIKLFVDLGILKKKYRGANKTCVYFMGSLLYLDQVKLCLKDILPNLWWSFNSMMKIAEESLHNTFITMAQKSYFAFNQNKFPARLSNDNNKDKNTENIYSKDLPKEKNISDFSLEQIDRRKAQLEREQKKIQEEEQAALKRKTDFITFIKSLEK